MLSNVLTFDYFLISLIYVQYFQAKYYIIINSQS